jgi:type II secretory pathway component PulF
MCFSVAWIVQMLVVLVVLCAVIAILRIWVLPMLNSVDSRIPATINILIWAVVCIFVIYLVADLLFCAIGGGPLFPRVR